MKRNYTPSVWSLWTLVLFVSGCHGVLIPETEGSIRTIEVILPSLSDYVDHADRSYPAFLEWRVQWWDGREVKQKVLSNANPRGDSSLTVSIHERGADAFVVSAVPVLMPVGIPLRGYGGWGYPPDRRCVLILDRGCLSETVLRVARDGLSPDRLNLERMQHIIDSEYRKGVAEIDVHRLEEGLRSLAFRHYHIRPLSRTVLEVRTHKDSCDSTAAGNVWFTDDQRFPRIEAVVAGEYLVWSVPVAPGETRKFWRPAERMTLTRTNEGHGRYHVFRSE